MSEIQLVEISSTQYLNKKSINRFINEALKEDIGSGDHSTLATIKENQKSEAIIISKDEGIVAGIDLAEMIFLHLDPEITLEKYVNDGDAISIGDELIRIKGSTRAILSGERLALNCMQRMSGIATKTRSYADLIKHFKANLLDTRKTTPNFRMMEKWAVKIGGGMNHRFGLYDMIMLKDNHIDYAGGIPKALKMALKYKKKHNLPDLKIEVETRTLEEVAEVLDTGGADIIMLDNMMPSVMKEAIELIQGQALTEASGGITETTIQQIAETGVDYISVGALTHSYTSLDISLNAV